MNFVAWMIVAAEIAFWVVILAGLITRYLLKREKLGFFFLALTPVIDLILLATTSIDLYNGATATMAHAVAAIYIGVSLAFGKSMIRWADERFRYYIVKQGPKPRQLYGMDYAKHYFKSWLQHVLAYLIGSAFLLGIFYFIHDPSRTEVLLQVWRFWSIVLGIDLLIALSNFVWPKKAKA